MLRKACLVAVRLDVCNTFVKFGRVGACRALSSDQKVLQERVSQTFAEPQIDVLLKNVDKLAHMRELEVRDLEAAKQDVLSSRGTINEINYDAHFIEQCIQTGHHELGRSYFKHLVSQGKIQIGSMGKYFRLCYEDRKGNSEQDKELIRKLYEHIKNKYGDTYDQTTAEHCIQALAVLKDSEEAQRVLDNYSSFGVPSSKMYSVVVESLWSRGRVEPGWTLMSSMCSKGRNPLLNAYQAWLQYSSLDSRHTLLRLLNFIETYNLHIGSDLAFTIQRFFLQSQPAGSASLSKISSSGECRSCHSKLKPIELTNDEFNTLRQEFLYPVLLGQNVFLKSRPDEVKNFMGFLRSSGRVDVVLDGLNIAFSAGGKRTNPQVASFMVQSVVRHFADQGLSVMLLGRLHMNRWPKPALDYIRRHSRMFLTDNLSADDPFLLYAALHSGPGTIFVSRDLMRSHKFLLKDPKLEKLFSRWQQKHQYFLQYVNEKGRVTLKEPLRYLVDPQSEETAKGRRWHVPLLSGNLAGVPAHLALAQLSWLCIDL